MVGDDVPIGLSRVMDADGNELDQLFLGERILNGDLLIRSMAAYWDGEGQIGRRRPDGIR